MNLNHPNAASGMPPQVRLRAGEADIQLLEDSWRILARHPNVHWDFYWHITRTHRHESFVVESTDGVVSDGLWVGRVEQASLSVKIGYWRIGSINVKRLVVVTGGVLGEYSPRVARAMLAKAIELLHGYRADVLEFSCLDRKNPLVEVVSRPGGWCVRDFYQNESVHWRMNLPSSFSEFLSSRSKKHRYWLKRISRMVEAAFPGQVRIVGYRDASDVLTFCRDADRVAELTYQRRMGESFCSDSDNVKRCQLWAEDQSFRGYVLYVNNSPKAFWLATVFREVIYLNHTGYVPEFKQYELGTILLLRLFEEHCGSGVRVVDFGQGDALYKKRFGDQSSQEISPRVYRLTARGIFANLLTSMDSVIAHFISQTVGGNRFVQKIKTRWRARINSECHKNDKDGDT